VVVAVMENHSLRQIMKPSRGSYICKLAVNGALFVNAFGASHPSAPNYFALFSGSTQGVSDDEDHTFTAPNLAEALRGAGKSFIGYVETASPRRHNPWESFTNALTIERNFTDFPSDFTQLPTVSFVIPNLKHDMHNGTVREGDTWLKRYLGNYANWATTHNSLLIVTFDESESRRGDNGIVTLIDGARVRPGQVDDPVDHYRLLRTIEQMYQLPPLGRAAAVPPITDIWTP
jgi:phosphatidylinositol-3-phosphatase